VYLIVRDLETPKRGGLGLIWAVGNRKKDNKTVRYLTKHDFKVTDP